MKEKKIDQKRLFKILYYVLLGFFGLVFICSAIYIGDYFIEAEKAGEEYKELQDLYVPPSRPPITEPTEPNGDSTDATEPTEPGDTEEPDGGLKTWVIVLIVVSSVLVLAGGAAVTVILIRKKRTSV